MDAKRYIVYRPDETDLPCRVYVRCDCGRFDRKNDCDTCEEEHDKVKHPEKEKTEWEYGGRRAKRSKKGWYEPEARYVGEQEQHDDQPPEKHDEHRKDCDDHWWKPECPEKEQTHVHEFLGSTKLAEECEDRHNHRFAGVSSEEIPIPGGHIHRIITHTDFFDHFHDICKLTGPAIEVEDKEIHCKGFPQEKNKWHKEKKHVHFVEGWTTFVDGHKHEFQLATLIESPLLPQPKHNR